MRREVRDLELKSHMELVERVKAEQVTLKALPEADTDQKNTKLTAVGQTEATLVTHCGRICLHRKKINLSTVFAGQAVGIKEVEEGIWLVSFMEYDLGYIDLEEKTLQPLDSPCGAKMLPCSRYVLLPMCPGRT